MAKRKKNVKTQAWLHYSLPNKWVIIFGVAISVIIIGSSTVHWAAAQIQSVAANRAKSITKSASQTIGASLPLSKIIVRVSQPAATSPSPKPVVKSPTVHSQAPQPTVKPSPASNVSGLTPASPTATSGSSNNQTLTSSYYSTNWSGYFSTSGSISSVSGAWIATSATGITGTTSADSSWIGIGGVTSGDLIQVGTDNIISSTGQLSTEAFYEMLPDFSHTVPGLTVKAGDSMSAFITEKGSGQWTVSITDNTTGQSYSNTFAYNSSLSSAEWIEEDPSYSFHRLIPFDNFHSASFTGGSATLNGSTQSIAGSKGVPIIMLNNSGQTIASPSNLGGDGASFTVTRVGI